MNRGRIDAWLDRNMPMLDHLNGDHVVRLGDTAGNNRVSGLNSGGVEIYRIDSVGRGAFSELQGALDTGLAARLVAPKAYGVLGAAIEDDDISAAFGAALPVGSIVVLTNDGLREYVQIGARSSSGGLPGHMHVPDANVAGAYTITRDLTGSGALAWRAGTMWYALGVEGDYWIELKNEYGNPRLDMFTLGASLSDLSNYFHVGGMNGLFGVSGAAHGVGIGDYSGGNYIRFTDVGGLQIKAGGVNLATAFLPLTGGVLTGGLVVNESGADADTRIEGDTDANLVFVDAGNDKVGIGTNAPATKLHVNGDISIGSVVASTALGARVYHSAAQSTVTATPLTLAFDSETFDTDAIHDTVTNNSRLTCKTAGVYLITGHIRFEANTVGDRRVQIWLNGAAAIATQASVATAITCGLTVTAICNMAITDYVELTAYQTSGGNLNVLRSASDTPEFSMVRIA